MGIKGLTALISEHGASPAFLRLDPRARRPCPSSATPRRSFRQLVPLVAADQALTALPVALAHSSQGHDRPRHQDDVRPQGRHRRVHVVRPTPPPPPARPSSCLSSWTPADAPPPPAVRSQALPVRPERRPCPPRPAFAEADHPSAGCRFLIAVRQKDGEMLMNEQGEVTSHLMGTFYRTLRMVDHGIKPAYVFDGKPPDLKSGVVRPPCRCCPPSSMSAGVGADCPSPDRPPSPGCFFPHARSSRSDSRAARRPRRARRRPRRPVRASPFVLDACGSSVLLTIELVGRLARAGTAEDVDRMNRRQVRVTREQNAECQRLLRLMGIPVILVRPRFSLRLWSVQPALTISSSCLLAGARRGRGPGRRARAGRQGASSLRPPDVFSLRESSPLTCQPHPVRAVVRSLPPARRTWTR